ncbi:MAG: M56 family metallopeptidase, partial [Phycisphaerales bacterium JB038]
LLGISFLPATGISSDAVMRGLGTALGNGGVAATDPQGGLLTAAWLPIVLLALWFIGFLGSLTVLVGGLIASNGLVRRSYDCGFRLSPAFLRRLGIIAPAEVDVIVTDLATSPGSYGLFRSTILLPIDWLPIQQNGRLAPDDAVALRHVLEHEINHVRRHDGLYQFVLRLLAAPLWFHPLSYLIIRKWIDVIEIAVDARVLRDGYIDRTQYAKTLISAVRRSIPSRIAAGTWFLGDSRRRAVRVLHRRLHTVLTPPKKLSHWGRIASLACAIAVLTSFPVTVVSVRSAAPAQSTNAYATAHGIPTHYYWRGEVVSYEQLPPRQQEQVRLVYASSDGRWALNSNVRPVLGNLDASLLLTDWNTAYRAEDGGIRRFASSDGPRTGTTSRGLAQDMPIPAPAPRP